jgi:hypothetical protein
VRGADKRGSERSRGRVGVEYGPKHGVLGLAF